MISCRLSVCPRIDTNVHESESKFNNAFAEARVAASEADIRAGRYAKGTADELMSEIMEG